ncbi:unnamed protein product [Nippostrongylus brasiliensis]|uniref:Carbohydrate sulfotransferase n=1 Tax=Nippostrongylus brasiliensis TaxID=27835 RepID=A0A0N4YWY8_NIPBR|nr:unnamed protein product [Nippostrongylus brasiliensis]
MHNKLRRRLLAILLLSVALLVLLPFARGYFKSEPVEPWFNITYDSELVFRSYATHPAAAGILAAVERQALLGKAGVFPETWALPAFGQLRENIMVAPRYRLATCQIEKIMSTIRHAMFCYLTNPFGFRSNNKSMRLQSWTESFCGWSNYRSDIDAVEREANQKYIRFAIIRDPFERFLSGFIDKCLKQCNFKKQLKYYRLIVFPEGPTHSEIIAREITRILKEAFVPRDMRTHIRRELSKGKSRHSTSDALERGDVRERILSNRYLRRLIALIYYFDYVVFGFAMPSWFFI